MAGEPVAETMSCLEASEQAECDGWAVAFFFFFFFVVVERERKKKERKEGEQGRCDEVSEKARLEK